MVLLICWGNALEMFGSKGVYRCSCLFVILKSVVPNVKQYLVMFCVTLGYVFGKTSEVSSLQGNEILGYISKTYLANWK